MLYTSGWTYSTIPPLDRGFCPLEPLGRPFESELDQHFLILLRFVPHSGSRSEATYLHHFVAVCILIPFTIYTHHRFIIVSISKSFICSFVLHNRQRQPEELGYLN